MRAVRSRVRGELGGLFLLGRVGGQPFGEAVAQGAELAARALDLDAAPVLLGCPDLRALRPSLPSLERVRGAQQGVGAVNVCGDALPVARRGVGVGSV